MKANIVITKPTPTQQRLNLKDENLQFNAKTMKTTTELFCEKDKSIYQSGALIKVIRICKFSFRVPKLAPQN